MENIILFNLSILLLIPINLLLGQEYKFISFQDEYIELDDYTSLTLENGGESSWFKRFELGFDFPYYDRVYDYLNVDARSIYYFDDDANFSIQLCRKNC